MAERWTDRKTGFIGDVPSGARELSFKNFLKSSLGNLGISQMSQQEMDGSIAISKSFGKFEKIIYNKKEEMGFTPPITGAIYAKNNDASTTTDYARKYNFTNAEYVSGFDIAIPKNSPYLVEQFGEGSFLPGVINSTLDNKKLIIVQRNLNTALSIEIITYTSIAIKTSVVIDLNAGPVGSWLASYGITGSMLLALGCVFSEGANIYITLSLYYRTFFPGGGLLGQVVIDGVITVTAGIVTGFEAQRWSYDDGMPNYWTVPNGYAWNNHVVLADIEAPSSPNPGALCLSVDYSHIIPLLDSTIIDLSVMSTLTKLYAVYCIFPDVVLDVYDPTTFARLNRITLISSVGGFANPTLAIYGGCLMLFCNVYIGGWQSVMIKLSLVGAVLDRKLMETNLVLSKHSIVTFK